MRDWFRSLLPDYWIMNHSYSAVWDARLRALMAEHKFEWITDRRAGLGPLSIWVANHPYASFTQYPSGCSEYRPSRRTIVYARRKLVSDLSTASE